MRPSGSPAVGRRATGVGSGYSTRAERAELQGVATIGRTAGLARRAQRLIIVAGRNGDDAPLLVEVDPQPRVWGPQRDRNERGLDVKRRPAVRHSDPGLEEQPELAR